MNMNSPLERAEWWVEVTNPHQMIFAGCPMRREINDEAHEYRAAMNHFVHTLQPYDGIYIDSRWVPEAKGALCIQSESP